MNEMFLAKLDRARGLAKIPFRITSGYRCVNHNKDVGSKPTSSHIKGRAADIACHSDADRYRIVVCCIANNFKRIGIYPTHIHVDNDPRKTSSVIWYGK